MNREDIFEGLKEIIVAVRPGTDLQHVSLESRLVNDLGIDSLSMLLLSLATEHKFNIRFENDATPFETVGDVCDYVLSQIG